jgi:sec-independent protein translocase protein TatB
VFGFGWSEFVLMLGLVLVVLGPRRMPEVLQKIGRLTGRARAMARQFTEQLDREANEIRSAASVPDDKPATPGQTQGGPLSSSHGEKHE